jgi:hypothetical protein
LQLEISNWYYVFLKWLLNSIKHRSSRYKKLIFKKSLPTKYKLMKQRKQMSYYTPNWVLTNQFYFLDIKPYLEIDFLTLSFFVVYDHNYLSYSTPNDLLVIRNNTYRMYNWKYIN